jgi:hypothetical protein
MPDVRPSDDEVRQALDERIARGEIDGSGTAAGATCCADGGCGLVRVSG